MFEQILSHLDLIPTAAEKKSRDILFVSADSDRGSFVFSELVKGTLADSGSYRSVRHLQSVSRKHPSWSFKRLSGWLGELSNCGTVSCNCNSFSSFWRKLLPVMVLVKFFGGNVILHLKSTIVVDQLVNWRRITRSLLNIADDLLVESRMSSFRLTEIGLSNVSRLLPIPLELPLKTQREPIQPKILVIAPLDRDHNPNCAVRAFSLVKRKYPRAELTFVGEGKLSHTLRMKIQVDKLHGIRFQSSVDNDYEALLKEHDLFLNCASRSAGHAWLLTALSCGIPVLTTDESSAVEIVRDRQNGLIFGINSHVHLAELIIELIESPQLAAKLASRGLSDVSQYYCWHAVKPAWLQIYTPNS